MIEIKRKFAPKQLPDLSKVAKKTFRRFIIYKDAKTELRVQKIDDIFQIERLESQNSNRTIQTLDITENEFNLLKTLGGQEIIRDCYLFSDTPNIEIMIYRGKFQGLVRIEVEFENDQEAKLFKPLNWFGREITGLKIANDADLAKLSGEELKRILDSGQNDIAQ